MNQTAPEINVLHVLTHLIHGGTEFYVLRQSEALATSVTSTITYLGSRHDMGSLFEAAGLQVVPLEHRGTSTQLRTLVRLLRLIKSQRIALVQTHSRLDRLNGHLAAVIARVPVIDTIHSEFAASRYSSERDHGARRRLRLSVEDRLRRRAVRHIVFVSHEMHRLWKEVGHRYDVPGVPTSVIGPTINFAAYEPPTQAVKATRLDELGLAGRSPILISVGRFIETKRHVVLPDLMARVKEDHPEAVMLIVGDGEMSDAVTERVQHLRLDDTVRLLGVRSDVADLLAIADLFVMPSVTEGWGIAAAEASAAGLPVVANDLPPLREVVASGENGWLVPVGDAEALTDATLAVLADLETYRANAHTARPRIAQQFGSEAAADRALAVYRDIVQYGSG